MYFSVCGGLFKQKTQLTQNPAAELQTRLTANFLGVTSPKSTLWTNTLTQTRTDLYTAQLNEW